MESVARIDLTIREKMHGACTPRRSPHAFMQFLRPAIRPGTTLIELVGLFCELKESRPRNLIDLTLPPMPVRESHHTVVVAPDRSRNRRRQASACSRIGAVRRCVSGVNPTVTTFRWMKSC